MGGSGNRKGGINMIKIEVDRVRILMAVRACVVAIFEIVWTDGCLFVG